MYPGLALAAAMLCSNAAAQEFAGSGGTGEFGIFDEVRLGGSFSIQGSSPDGLLVNGQVLFGTFVRPFGNYFLDTLLRPRAACRRNRRDATTASARSMAA